MKKRLLCILLSICLSFQISILYENNVLCSSIKTYAADSADIASMNPIEQTYSFIKKFEGCATTCFWDNSQWTIGIGNKCPYNHSSKGTYWHEKGGHTISEEDAHTLFFTEMPEYVSRLKANCKGLYVTQNQFDVLLSGTYNHGNVLPGGCSKCGYIKHPLIQYLYGNYTEEEAREAYYVWCINKGTKDEKGLRTRRIEEADQTIPDGDYWILSALSRNFWVDIPGDEISKNGENVTTYIREVNEVPSKYDAWTVTYLNNGYYKIKQKDTDLCLDVADASLYAGTNVQIVNDNGAPAQQWSIIPTQTGYKLQSRCNSFVLDVTNGIIENNTNIMVWESNEQRTQRFGFIPYGTDEDRVVKDGTYQINSKVSDAYCIDASGEGAKNEYHNGTDIHLWTNDSDDVFKITYAGDGYYKIQEVVSGLYVEVINAGSILDTQTNVQLYEGNNSLGQYWKIRKNSNGSYTFVSKLSGYNLDLEDGKATQGQNISQHFNNDSTAQQWTLKNTNNDVEGDCNNDGKFTIADIVMLQKWLLNDGTVLDNWKAADLYEDDMLNVFDLALMKQMIANAE